jgi:hypothetical protein
VHLLLLLLLLLLSCIVEGGLTPPSFGRHVLRHVLPSSTLPMCFFSQATQCAATLMALFPTTQEGHLSEEQKAKVRKMAEWEAHLPPSWRGKTCEESLKDAQDRIQSLVMEVEDLRKKLLP